MLPWIDPSPDDLLADIRDTSLAKLVRDAVLRASGDLAPGQRINEPDVAAWLGVSRVPVREALRIVQQLHLSRLKNLSRDMGMRASLVEHQRIIATIAAGDSAGAQILLAEHVTASHVRLSELLAADAATERATLAQ